MRNANRASNSTRKRHTKASHIRPGSDKLVTVIAAQSTILASMHNGAFTLDSGGVDR